MIRCRQPAVDTEKSCPHKLERIRCLRVLQRRLHIAVLQDGQGVRVQVQLSRLLVVDTFLFIDKILKQTDLAGQRRRGIHPVDRPSDLAAIRRIATPCSRVICAVNSLDLTAFILLYAGACDKICVHQADFIAGIQPSVPLDRYLHEIVPVDVQLPPKRNQALSKFRILKVVFNLKLLRLSLRIVVDDESDRIQDGHDTRLLQLLP